MSVHWGGRGPGHTSRKSLLGVFSPGGTPGDTSIALTAPTLTRTSSATTYPPLVDFTRPIDWIDGDQAVMQRSQDPTFATGVSEAVQTILAATTTYNFGLSSIASGSWFMRMAAWRGSRPANGSLNWSNITNVGDVTAPTITSSATQSSPSVALTADEPVTWAIVGGADAAGWQIVGSILSVINPTITQSVHTVQVQATDYAGNVSTAQTITNTIDITPTAFTFTDITGATTSTVYTSNTVTVTGLGSGVTTVVSITGGTYSKNGGTYTSAAGTATNGDTFAVQVTSSGVGGTGVGATLTIGAVSDTYSVTTTGFVPADLWTASEAGDWWDVTDMSTMFQDTAGATPVTAVGQMVKRWVGKKNGTVMTPLAGVSTNGPTLQFDGTYYYLSCTSVTTNGNLLSSYLQVASASTGEWTLATAALAPDSTTARTIMNMEDASFSHKMGGMYANSGGAVNAYGYDNGGTTYTDATAASAYSGGTAFTAIAVRSPTTIETFANNTSNGSTATSGTPSKVTSNISVGSNGINTPVTMRYYGAVIGIGRAITSTERGNLHTWLDNRS